MRPIHIFKCLALALLCLSLTLGGQHPTGPVAPDLGAEVSPSAPQPPADADANHRPLAHPTTTTPSTVQRIIPANVPGKAYLAPAGPRRPPRTALTV